MAEITIAYAAEYRWGAWQWRIDVLIDGEKAMEGTGRDPLALQLFALCMARDNAGPVRLTVNGGPADVPEQAIASAVHEHYCILREALTKDE